MSNERKGTGPRNVLIPDIHLVNPDLGTPGPIGPQNLVIQWELAPFHQFAQDAIGDEAKEWDDHGAWVLSLRTANPKKVQKFCLSPGAVADMAKKIPQVLRSEE